MIRHSRRLANRHFAIALVTAASVVGGYYLFTYSSHGTFFPSSRPPYSGPQFDDPMSFLEFVREFIRLMIQHVPMIVNHATTAPLGELARALCLAYVSVPVLGLLLSNLSGKRNDGTVVANLMFVALALTLAAHIIVSWNTYLDLGQVRATQPRYYFYLIPAIAAFSFSSFCSSRLLKTVYWTFAMIVVAASILAPIRTISAERLQHSGPDAIRFELSPAPPVRMPHTSADHLIVGTVGRPTRSADTIFTRGWAVDAETFNSAASVEIYYGDRKIEAVTPNRPRADVATALRDADARNSGFEVLLQGVPPEVSACDIRYVAVQGSGQRITLPPPPSSCG